MSYQLPETLRVGGLDYAVRASDEYLRGREA